MDSKPLTITSNFTEKLFLELEPNPRATRLMMAPGINIMQMDQLIPGNILAVFRRGIVTITRAWEITYVLKCRNTYLIHSKRFA